MRHVELLASTGAWGAASSVLDDVLRDGSLVRRRLDTKAGRAVGRCRDQDLQALLPLDADGCARP